MSRDVIIFLEDILTAIDDIVVFTAALDFEDFKQDRKTIYAVTRALEIMGEATKNIPDDVRQAYPQIPWRQIAGMRDKLIHRPNVQHFLAIKKRAIHPSQGDYAPTAN